MRAFCILSGGAVIPVKAFLAYSRLLEVGWLYIGRDGRYLYKARIEELSTVFSRCSFNQKRAADESFVARKARELTVRFCKSQLSTMSEARSVAGTAGVQLDDPVTSHPYNGIEGGDNKDGGHAEKVWEMQHLRDQSSCGVSAPDQIQLFCKKAGLHVPANLFEAQKLITKGLPAIPENPIFFAALSSGSDTLKVKKESLRRKIDKLNTKHYSRQGKKSNAKLAELRQTRDVDEHILKEKLCDRNVLI